MLKRVPNTELADLPTYDPATAVPLSALEAEGIRPAAGWDAWLAGKGMTIVADDIGRRSVTRDDARRLLAERVEAAERAREAEAQRRARLAEQRSAQRRVRRGVPASDPSLSAYETMMLNEPREPRRKGHVAMMLDGEFDQGAVIRGHRDGAA